MHNLSIGDKKVKSRDGNLTTFPKGNCLEAKSRGPLPSAYFLHPFSLNMQIGYKASLRMDKVVTNKKEEEPLSFQSLFISLHIADSAVLQIVDKENSPCSYLCLIVV